MSNKSAKLSERLVEDSGREFGESSDENQTTDERSGKYEAISNGVCLNAKETYWLLRLEHPRCVGAAKDFSGAAHSRIRRVQLVFDVGDRLYEKYRNLVGRNVEASGTLFEAHSGHHHTEVLLTVRDLRPVPRRVK